MTDIGTDWRLLDGVVTAWFESPSMTSAASLASRVVELSDQIRFDLRRTGIRVRLDSPEQAEAVSALAQEGGLAARPEVLQQLRVVLESPDPSRLNEFWPRALGYPFTDPLSRDPELRIQPSQSGRPLRNRVHVDVVRPATVLEQTDLGEGFGPYGVRHTDADGNEVDLVPGDALDGLDDWQAVFSAVACYRVTSRAQQRELATAVAELADTAGFPLLVDLRPGLVIIDSGKDQWEPDTHGPDLDFASLARDVQAASRELGATPDLSLPRFVQLVLDAADIEAVRGFWLAALDYVRDQRSGVTDSYDPRRLSPELVFQDFDVTETERRRQRNRIFVELTVPSDVALMRLAAMVAAGGRVLDESKDWWRVADPEGNELVILAAD